MKNGGICTLFVLLIWTHIASHFISLRFCVCHHKLVLELSLLESMGKSHCIRLVSIVKVLKSIFVCMNGLALQEVAVKKFLDQDFSGDALAQFKSEVSSYYYMRMFNAFMHTYMIHAHMLPFAD